MTLFQYGGLALLAMFIVVTGAASMRGHLGRIAAMVWIALWIAAAVAIARPNLTMTVAHALGIDRGADLVFYCAILSAFGAFFIVFIRFRRLEQNLTEVVRQLAIRAPLEPQDDAGRDAGADQSPRP